MRKKILAFSLSLLFFGSIAASSFGMTNSNIDDNKDKAKTTKTTEKKSDKTVNSKTTTTSDCATKKSCCAAEKSCTDGPDKK